jgi:hypothetical protein
MLTGVKLEKFASAVGEGKIVFKYMLINLFFFKKAQNPVNVSYNKLFGFQCYFSSLKWKFYNCCIHLSHVSW